MCHLHFVVQVLSFWFDSFFIQRSMAVASSLRTFSSFLFLFFFWPLFPVLRFHSFSLRRPKNKWTSRTTIWTGARSEKSSSGLFWGGVLVLFCFAFFFFYSPRPGLLSAGSGRLHGVAFRRRRDDPQRFDETIQSTSFIATSVLCRFVLRVAFVLRFQRTLDTCGNPLPPPPSSKKKTR